MKKLVYILLGTYLSITSCKNNNHPSHGLTLDNYMILDSDKDGSADLIRMNNCTLMSIGEPELRKCSNYSVMDKEAQDLATRILLSQRELYKRMN